MLVLGVIIMQLMHPVQFQKPDILLNEIGKLSW